MLRICCIKFFQPLQSAIKACSHCQHVVKSDEPSDIGQNSETETQTDHRRMTEQGREEKAEGSRMEEQKRREQEKEVLRAHIREVEQELVQTKLKMVEATCKIQVRPGSQTIYRFWEHILLKSLNITNINLKTCTLRKRLVEFCDSVCILVKVQEDLDKYWMTSIQLYIHKCSSTYPGVG